MRRLILTAPLAFMLLAAGAGCNSSNTPVGTGELGATPTTTAPVLTDPPTTAPPPPPATTSAPKPPAESWPSNGVCISYNPAKLTARYEAGYWSIEDGNNVVVAQIAGGPTDSDVGDLTIALAKRYRTHCYLGLNNTRGDDPHEYVFDYWRNQSGIQTTIAGEEDLCSPYNRNNLTVEDMGSGQGWRVKDHDHVLHLFDTQQDAKGGKLVASKYNQICSIGHDDYDRINYFRS